MKIVNVPGTGNVYTTNVYLVLGYWKRIHDVNAMVDVGSDPAMLDALENIGTGVGKRKVELVILTHGHSDHYANLAPLKKAYNPTVMAYSNFLSGVDHCVKDGEKVPMGDTMFEVLHTPGHSEDSICLYHEPDGVLFVGDTPVIIRSPGGTYEPRFIESLERICSRRVNTIYFGHGDPLTKDADRHLRHSLDIVKASARRTA